jgi:hypothetical protein
MVWDFQRFEGAPVLDDFINRRSNLQIFFPTDVPERCKSPDPNYLRIMSMSQGAEMPADFYKMIEPVFIFPASAIPHSIGYDLHVYEGGVTRNIMSDVKDTQHPNVTWVTPKKVGFGDFQDLKLIGEYVARRFPDIADEIRLPADSLEASLPFYALESRGWYTQETSLVEWPDFTKVVGNRFREWFLAHVMDRFDKSELGPREVMTLQSLVKGLQ